MTTSVYTRNSHLAQEVNSASADINNEKRRAYRVEDGDEGVVIVFATSGAAARRLGARELDCDFESVELCRRAPEFDSFADRGFVPAEELIAAGWQFECNGCFTWVNSDLEGWIDDKPVRLNPIYEDHGVWCTPECKARHFEDKRIREKMQDAAIEDFKRRVHRRLPDVEFTTGEHSKPHAYACQRNGIYGLRQVVVYFSFPGQKIGPASYRWDLEDSYTLVGPRPPAFWCCGGDKEAFEAYAELTSQAGGAE